MTARVKGEVRPQRSGQIDREKGGPRIKYKRRAGARRESVKLWQPPGEQLRLLVCETIGSGYRVNASKEVYSEQCEATPNIDKYHGNKKKQS